MLDSISVPTASAIAALMQLGYLTSTDVTEDELKAAIASFQVFHKLPQTGEMDIGTVHLMTNPHRCGLPDMMAAEEAMWPMKRVAFLSRLNLGLPNAGAIYAQGAQQWNDCSGIELFAVTDISLANIYADDYSNPRDSFGQRGGVLADSGVPFGATPKTKIPQRYDTAEAWDDVMLLAVATHELGHAIGLGHLSKGNLLAPYYDRRITKPQAGDIEEVVRRYGRPQPKTPPTGTTGGTRFDVSIDANWGIVVIAERNGEKRRAAGTMSPIAAVASIDVIPGGVV